MSAIIVPMILPMGLSRCADCRCPCHDEPEPSFQERTATGKAVSVLGLAGVLFMAAWGASLLWGNGPMGCQDNDWRDNPCDSGDYFMGVLMTALGVLLTLLLSGLAWSFGNTWAKPSVAQGVGRPR